VTSISGFEKLFLDFRILNNEFKILQSVGNSVFISSISSVILVILGYTFVKLKLERTALIPIYVSTAFWGISLVYLEIIFGLPEIIIAIIGFTIINLPLAYNFLASSVLDFKNEILEAARLRWGK
jgi:thiamine transport system permease protein